MKRPYRKLKNYKTIPTIGQGRHLQSVEVPMMFSGVPEGVGPTGFKSFWGNYNGNFSSYNNLVVIVGWQRFADEGLKTGSKNTKQNWSTGGSRLCLEEDYGL